MSIEYSLSSYLVSNLILKTLHKNHSLLDLKTMLVPQLVHMWYGALVLLLRSVVQKENLFDYVWLAGLDL